MLCNNSIFQESDNTGNKKPAVEGRRANLMFSQRNNPYCDLLKILSAKIVKTCQNRKGFALYFIFLQK